MLEIGDWGLVAEGGWQKAEGKRQWAGGKKSRDDGEREREKGERNRSRELRKGVNFLYGYTHGRRTRADRPGTQLDVAKASHGIERLWHLALEDELPAADGSGQLPPFVHQLPYVIGHFRTVSPIGQLLPVDESRFDRMVGQVEANALAFGGHRRIAPFSPPKKLHLSPMRNQCVWGQVI